MQEQELKVTKEVRNNLEIFPSSEQTYVIVCAVNKDATKNNIARISCKKGLPLGGYVYDSQADCYHVNCSDYLHLGFIPVSYIGKMNGLFHWSVKLPLPESIVKKYLTPLQKKELRNFRNHFSVEEFDIQYIQMIDAN